MLANQGQAAELVNISDIAARTATFQSSWFDVRKYEGDILIMQEVGVVSGTTPSLAGTFEDATDISGTGAAALSGVAYTAVTASNSKQKLTIPAGNNRGFIRYVGTISGTTPSFTMGVTALSHPKYTT